MHDPDGFFWKRALRAAIVVPVVYFVLFVVFDQQSPALLSAFACFSILVFADFGGPFRDRTLANLTLTVVGIVFVVLGSLAAVHPALAVASTLVVIFAISYSSVLRGYIGAASTAAMLPWLFAATAAFDLEQIPGRVMGWAIGGSVATVAAVTMWPTHRISPLRLRTADALEQAAIAIRSLTSDNPKATDLEPLAQSLKELHAAFDGQLARPGSATQRDRSLVAVVEELDRFMTLIGAWRDSTTTPLRPSDVGLGDVSAESLEQCARALRLTEPPASFTALNDARESHLDALTQWAQEQLEETDDASAPDSQRMGQIDALMDRMLVAFHVRITALATQLLAFHAAGAVGQEPDSNQWATYRGRALVDPRGATSREILRSQWSPSSPWFRAAVRASLALSITVLVVALVGVQHGFWASLGALVALKFDASGTRRTSGQVLLGTLIGFAVSSGIVLAVGHRSTLLWVLLPITVFLAAFTPGAISLIVGQASFTLFVVILFGITDPDTLLTGELRVIDILIGLLTSLVVSVLLWPRGVVPYVCKTMSAAISVAGAYFVSTFDLIVDGPVVLNQVRDLERSARIAVRQAEENVDLVRIQGVEELPHLGANRAVVVGAARLVYAGELVGGLASTNPWPDQANESADLVIAYAHHVQTCYLGLSSLLGLQQRAEQDTDGATSQAALAAEQADELCEHIEDIKGRVTTQVRPAVCRDLGRLDPADPNTGKEAALMAFSVAWLTQATWLAQRLSRRVVETSA